MPLMTSGVYIGSDDRGYEAETSYYLNFQIISALASLAKIDSFNDSYGWENPCQYYHYYTDHLLFSIGQITNRFQVNNRDSEKEKERKTLNRGNYQFSEDRFPLLSDKKARNVVEHIDEYNLNIIESNRGVGGFNLIDASTESTRVQTLDAFNELFEVYREYIACDTQRLYDIGKGLMEGICRSFRGFSFCNTKKLSMTRLNISQK